MSRKRKNYGQGCDQGCASDNHEVCDPSDNLGSRKSGRAIFPRDIKSLLILISQNEDDDTRRATIILDACPNHCLIEDAIIIAVTDNTVVVREDECFRFVCIGCICEVVTNCETLVEGIFEGREINRR